MQKRATYSPRFIFATSETKNNRNAEIGQSIAHDARTVCFLKYFNFANFCKKYTIKKLNKLK